MCGYVSVYTLNLIKMNPSATVETYLRLTVLNYSSQVSEDQDGKNKNVWDHHFNLFLLTSYSWQHQVSAVACRIIHLQHVGSSSLMRDWTHAPYTDSAES